MNIRFSDVTLEKNEPITVYDAAAEAGIISRAVLAAKVGGRVCALTELLCDDADVTLLTFADDEGKYYLLLLDVGMSAYSRLDKLTFILEYGRRENPDCLLSYVNEHGKVICREKAIETLSNY